MAHKLCCNNLGLIVLPGSTLHKSVILMKASSLLGFLIPHLVFHIQLPL